MKTNVMLLWYIHFWAMSNSNRAVISPLKSRDRQLKILTYKWSEIFNSNWPIKAQRKWNLRFARQVLPEIFKVKLNHSNVNIQQGQLNFDWFTHQCTCGPHINKLVTEKNTEICCWGFILVQFQSTTANKIDSDWYPRLYEVIPGMQSWNISSNSK